MFEMMIAEKLVMEIKSSRTIVESEHLLGKPMRIKASLTDRFLSNLGRVMVDLGFRLIDRSCATKAAEPAPAPNFLIML
ncbi:MAG: hypothetical protein C3F13_00950 [Anaerolineales bacterium]|nr:hypothetical protein [Anaerolineae bacterium]PWB56670.1 MAG: hypothetical protein C3F13_00950 [Anaerolineales bacterium]